MNLGIGNLKRLRGDEMFERIRRLGIMNKLHVITAAVCSLFFLVFVPLVFRNGLFDINRIKVDAITAAAPVFALACAFAFAVQKRTPRICRELRMPCAFLFSFLAACVVSSARRGFDQASLLGGEGRLCGLVFLLSCGCAFFVIVLGALEGNRIADAACVAAAVIALLGTLNAVGVDPLGFYANMQKGQWHLFVSTIGNIDFFGCYLALMLPICAACFVHAEGMGRSRLGLILSVCIMTGIAASRSDSALLAIQIGMLAQTVLAGNSYAKMAKSLFLWGISFALLPIVHHMLLNAKFHVPLSGLFPAMCTLRIAHAAAALLFLAAMLCVGASAKRLREPGVKRFAVFSLVLLAVLAAAVIGLMVYFTVISPDSDAGVLASYLRFDDHWGTRRGFVYRRSLRAFADYPLIDCLFGKGVDCARSILEPYFDDPSMLAYGKFNDAHCQPLQYLLTTGIIGCGSLIAFHASLLVRLGRRHSASPLFSGYFSALAAYIPIALLNVAQPILMAVYMAVCAAASSSIQYFSTREGNP